MIEVHPDRASPARAEEKPAPAVDRIAADIRAHYQAVFEGDDAVWSRIKRLLVAPKDKSRLPLP